MSDNILDKVKKLREITGVGFKDCKNAIDENTVAFMMEPIQGEGGIIIPPEGFLKEVREVCTQNNILGMIHYMRHIDPRIVDLSNIPKIGVVKRDISKPQRLKT